MSKTLSLCSLGALVCASALLGQPPTFSPLAFVPGDTAVETSVESQDWPEVAAGGPGYLVVWQDKRTVLSGFTQTPGLPLTGNDWDIYGAILDADGNVLVSPIVIANEGMNQTRPRVAWNGQSWLVVWMSERPDWYFFEDIVGRRISPQGEVLDVDPIPIRLETNAHNNDHGDNPWVASDGVNWVVVWEDVTWGEVSGDLNLSAVRLAADGTILDPQPKILYQFVGIVFGPEDPKIVWAGDEYLLVWENFGDLLGRRFDAALQPLDAPFTITTVGANPRLATNGAGFLVVSSYNRAYRLDHAGQPLDGNDGISFDLGGDRFQISGPDVAWEGGNWLITMPYGETVFSDSDVYAVRIDTAGNILGGGPSLLLGKSEDEWQPVVVGAPGGGAQVVFTQWFDHVLQDIRSLHLDPAGVSGPDTGVGVGLGRQAWLRFASNGNEHLAVYTREGGGRFRILAQRLDATGGAIDREPIEVYSFQAGDDFVFPDVAFNGTVYLVAWAERTGTILGRRLSADGVPIDPAPVPLVVGQLADDMALGALGPNFLLAFTYTVSGDLEYLKAARVRGADLVLLDTPFDIGFNFAIGPRVASLGSRWLVVWESQVSHDRSDSSIRGVFVEANGTPTPSFRIDQAGQGDDPDLAVGLGQALVVWHDNVTLNDPRIEGRIVLADGTMLGGEIAINDGPGYQYTPRAAWDGEQYFVAWTDYRSVSGIEQLRGDIWAARVKPSGGVLDPDGIQLTAGALPEDLPDVAGFQGKAVVAFSKLGGVSQPEVQRLASRTSGLGMSLTARGVCPGPLTLELRGATPFAGLVLAGAPAQGSFVVPGGACAGTVLDIARPSFHHAFAADGEGRLSLSFDAPAGACGRLLQAVDLAACATSTVVHVP